jgi:two-component system, OmpR family, KDP operon response regulator KdpE
MGEMMMAPEHILIIDDEVQIRRLLRSSLGECGYRVTAVATGDQGLDAAAADPPAVVILDPELPDMDGLEVCAQLRSWSDVPIIMISAHDAEIEKVRALDQGADDYLTKPVGVQELLARIRVALRRAEQRRVVQPAIASGDLLIDLARRRVTVAGVDIHLTPTEYDLLKVLATNADHTLTHQWLLERVWGPGYAGDVQNLHVFISQLRRKLESQLVRPRYIITEPGVGYRFRSSL